MDANQNNNETTTTNNVEETADDGMDADYIAEKLKEIAKLKAQLKRIDAMNKINKDIEKHLSTRVTSTTVAATEEPPTVEEPPQLEAPINAPLESIVSAVNAVDDVESTRAELLATLTGMFTDYADDLRTQAESLRAERLRIAQLKEKLIASKNPK